MTWVNAGFNFRGSLGFVTDGADETGVTNDAYPTTRDGFTFGWVAPPAAANNRNAGIDRRLAGAVGPESNNPRNFRVDLPVAGSYYLTLAVGDYAFGSNNNAVYIQDGVGTLWSFAGEAVTANQFIDAQQNKYNADDWPASNDVRLLTFRDTTMIMRCGEGSGGSFTLVAHMALAAANLSEDPDGKIRAELAASGYTAEVTEAGYVAELAASGYTATIDS